MSEDLRSTKFMILFSDFLSPDKGFSWLLRKFRNFKPIYKQHIPEALNLHCSNFSLCCIQNQSNSPDFTPFRSKHDILSPTYPYQDEWKMHDNPKRTVNLFFLVMNIVPPTTVPFSFFMNIPFSILDSRCKIEN